MRKLILISCFALSVLSFAAETKLPENVEKRFVMLFQLLLVLIEEKLMIGIKIHI